jgi:cobalt-zinc-cadmium efflux system outer membrane protein
MRDGAGVVAAGAAPLPPTAAPSARLLQDDQALLRWIMEHSPDVAASRAERSAALANARGARLFPNPTVDLSVSNFALGATNPSGLRRDRTLLYGVGLSETIELGKRSPRIAAADLHADAAGGRLSATLAERVAVARLALAQLVYARSRAEELDASLTQARAAAEVAKGRLDHQALSGVDYDRLLIDLATIETESAHAHADSEAAEAQCAAVLLARCENSEAGVAALEPAATVPASWDNAQLQQRADLRALRTESSAAQREADLAGAKAIPDLTFRLAYAHDMFTISGSLSNSLSLSVQAPLPVFDRGQHDKSEALARALQFSEQARAALTHARGDVTALFTRKRAVEGALARLENDSLPRANGVLEAEERGLREGQLDITDLLLVRREAIALRLQTLDLHFELFQLRNELRQALGLDEALAQR